MLCDICKKNEANVHITKIVNGVKQELNVCEKCARDMGDFNFGGEMINFNSPFTFQNILSGLVDYINQSTPAEESSELVCKNCGTTYSEFREKGFLGCSECYKNFSSTLTPIIKRVQGNVEHTGKIPKKLGKDLIEKRQLLKLKEDLKKAVAAEEYEKAAQIRDEIKEMENNK